MVKFNYLCQKLKELRLLNNLSQVELSKKTNLSQGQISKIENNQNFTIEVFLVLYNFYCEIMSSEKVMVLLFKSSNNYVPVILEKLKDIAEKNTQEVETLIKNIQTQHNIIVP